MDITGETVQCRTDICNFKIIAGGMDRRLHTFISVDMETMKSGYFIINITNVIHWLSALIRTQRHDAVGA